MDWNVIKLSEEGCSFLYLLILVCLREVNIVAFKGDILRCLWCLEISYLESLLRIEFLAVELVLLWSNLLRCLGLLLMVDWHGLSWLLVLLILLVIVLMGVVFNISSHSCSFSEWEWLFLWLLLWSWLLKLNILILVLKIDWLCLNYVLSIEVFFFVHLMPTHLFRIGCHHWFLISRVLHLDQ